MANYPEIYDFDDFVASGGVVDGDRLASEVHADPNITIDLGDLGVNTDTGLEVCKVNFKEQLPAEQKPYLSAIVAAHPGTPLPDQGLPVSVSNAELSVAVANSPTVAMDLRSESRVTMFSPNLADPCSWYQGSVESIEEVLTPSGGYERYEGANGNWIDLYHGRLSDEDDVASYPIVVTVNDSPVAMDTPFGPGGDGDFELDAEGGAVVFHTPLADTDVVKATHHYASSSEWVMKPDTGKNLELLAAECQMSKNVLINDTIQYQVFILGQFVGGPPGVPVPIRTKKYKNAHDFINESNGAYPEVPAFGGSARGIANPVLIFPWLYKTKTMLLSQLGMEIRVRLVDDKPCDGELAVVTFYCISSDA